jgi:hypothetical protein
MIDWSILIHLADIAAVGIGTYAAIRSDIAVMHANLLNTRDDVKELQKDVKRHDREIASMDRRHANGTGKYTAIEG